MSQHRVLDPTPIPFTVLPVAGDQLVRADLRDNYRLDPEATSWRLVEIPFSALADFVTESYLNYGDEEGEARVEDMARLYAIDGDLPPLLVVDHGPPTGWGLIDGFHRISAISRCVDMGELPADVGVRAYELLIEK